MSPSTFFANIAMLLAPSAVIAAVFALAGYLMVAWFCILQAVVVGAMGLVYAIHALDGEYLEIAHDTLKVRCVRGLASREYCFQVRWTRLEVCERTAVLELCSGRRRLRIAGQLSDAQKRDFVREFSRYVAVDRSVTHRFQIAQEPG